MTGRMRRTHESPSTRQELLRRLMNSPTLKPDIRLVGPHFEDSRRPQTLDATMVQQATVGIPDIFETEQRPGRAIEGVFRPRTR